MLEIFLSFRHFLHRVSVLRILMKPHQLISDGGNDDSQSRETLSNQPNTRPGKNNNNNQRVAGAGVHVAICDLGNGIAAAYFVPTPDAALAAAFAQTCGGLSPDRYRFTVPLNQSIIKEAIDVQSGDGKLYLCGHFGESGLGSVRFFRADCLASAAAKMQKVSVGRGFRYLYAVAFPDWLVEIAAEFVCDEPTDVRMIIFKDSQSCPEMVYYRDLVGG
jgi:hypothetical protein